MGVREGLTIWGDEGERERVHAAMSKRVSQLATCMGAPL